MDLFNSNAASRVPFIIFMVSNSYLKKMTVAICQEGTESVSDMRVTTPVIVTVMLDAPS